MGPIEMREMQKQLAQALDRIQQLEQTVKSLEREVKKEAKARSKKDD